MKMKTDLPLNYAVLHIRVFSVQPPRSLGPTAVLGNTACWQTGSSLLVQSIPFEVINSFWDQGPLEWIRNTACNVINDVMIYTECEGSCNEDTKVRHGECEVTDYTIQRAACKYSPTSYYVRRQLNDLLVYPLLTKGETYSCNSLFLRSLHFEQESASKAFSLII